MTKEVPNNIQVQIAKYGGLEGYRAEMKRRAALRKTIAPGKQFNSESSKEALRKRWDSHNGRSSNS